MSVHQGDTVILTDGREVKVLQKAEFDNIFEFEDSTGKSGWTSEPLVAWNKTEVEFASLDSDLMEDYT